MLATTRTTAVLALALSACSSETMEPGDPAATGSVAGHGGMTTAPTGSAGASGDSSVFVPAGLPSNATAGEDTALSLVAFTLVKGPTGSSEFYAAARNDGMTPICEPGMLVDFFDQAGSRVASAGIPLDARQLYRVTDGTVIPCVDPGQTAMGGNTALPAEVVADELGHFEYGFPAFVVSDLTPVTALGVGPLRTVRTLDGTAFSGTLSNTLDAPVSPNVHVFPLNTAGRPLGMASASGAGELQPGDTWSFQTSAVRDPGVGAAIYPSTSSN